MVMRCHLLLVVLTACATTSAPPAEKPGSRGPRASEHLAAARQHDEVARQQMAYPDLRHDGTGSVGPLMPWTRTWDTAADQERLAREHRSAAAQLQAEYDEACGAAPAAEVSISPLHQYGIGGGPIEEGAVIYLSPDAGAPEDLLRRLRCHRAWMMLAPTDMDNCPLDLARIQVAASGDANGITITITTHDKALVGELQRRAASELEAAAHRHPTKP
jgi:hypothetical protein